MYRGKPGDGVNVYAPGVGLDDRGFGVGDTRGT